jgi:hypothetical protein
MKGDHDPPPTRSISSLIWPFLIVAIAIIFVVLHLTGVLGPGSH